MIKTKSFHMDFCLAFLFLKSSCLTSLILLLCFVFFLLYFITLFIDCLTFNLYLKQKPKINRT